MSQSKDNDSKADSLFIGDGIVNRSCVVALGSNTINSDIICTMTINDFAVALANCATTPWEMIEISFRSRIKRSGQEFKKFHCLYVNTGVYWILD